MPSSGTTSFAPPLADLVLAAFGRCQIRPASLTSQHMFDARVAAQLLLIDFASEEGPNLWEIDLQSVPLVAGQATYSVPASTLTILDAYISVASGGSIIDRPILPMSRNQYAAIQNKAQQGSPTSYWLQRTLTPQVTLWPVPDAATTYNLNYYRVRQIQDAVLPGGTQLEIPYRFLSTFVDGLAAKLALTYPPPPPNTAEKMAALAAMSWKKASDQDIETGVPISIVPSLFSYYR